MWQNNADISDIGEKGCPMTGIYNENTAPLDAAAAAKAAFAAVEGKPFPQDIFTAPELNWAVIGCGVIANQMAQSLALAGRKVYGIANRTRDKAEAFAREYGVEHVYDTFEDLYADPAVDAIYITTPHNTHIGFLRDALAAGKHVLCEKAITLNSAELEEARAIAGMNISHLKNFGLMSATTTGSYRRAAPVWQINPSSLFKHPFDISGPFYPVFPKSLQAFFVRLKQKRFSLFHIFNQAAYFFLG